MATNAILQPEPAPIVACTVSRDVQKFDLLIEDMENELGESWGDLGYGDALDFLDSPDGAALEFIAIAMDDEDETDIALVSQLVRTAVKKDVRALLIDRGGIRSRARPVDRSAAVRATATRRAARCRAA